MRLDAHAPTFLTQKHEGPSGRPQAVGTVSDLMQTILISIPIGRSVKYFLDTPLYAMLRDRYRIVLLSPYHAAAEFRERYGGPAVTMLPSPAPAGGRIGSWLRKFYVRYSALHADFRLAGQPIGRFNIMIKKPYFKHSFRACQLAYHATRLAGGWDRVNPRLQRLFRDPYYENLFRAERPALAIATAPTRLLDSYAFQYSAQSSRTPLVLFPSSWDNFSRNGEFTFPFQRVMSWGPAMNTLARDLYGFRDDQLATVGMIRLETARPAMSPADFRTRFNIPADHRVLLFPTNQDILVKPEPRILAELVADIQAGKLGKVILLLRPNNTWSPLAKQYLQDYAQHPCVRLNLPEPDGAGTDLRPTDLAWLDVLANVDVIVTICSMLVVEAFHFDKPVVNLNYDYGEISALGYSYRVGYEREVYKPIVQSGAAWMADSREEVGQAVRAYLDNPALHRAERRRVLEMWDVPPPAGGPSRCQRAFDEIQRVIAEHPAGRTA